ncbi:MAG TPA: glycerol-3-phosphate dehydrogenase/oxidase [Planctomycetota bacterium]|nr:glycerol-3-phosphate dehydrogenase/oxidase [Planctomycetota bacterium]
MLAKVAAHLGAWDVLVIGGGATGVGVAVDAASRGHDVLLLEAHDFGKGTSSRSTKLAHGGVRYLEQGNIALVMEALKERGLMRRHAPHLVHELAFVVPSYDWWETPFYGLGLKLYNLLAGRYGFGPSTLLSREETLARIPTLKLQGLRGGVVYHDGQFDDSRLLVSLAQTAAEQGALLLNRAPVTELLRDGEGRVLGVVARDAESDRAIRAEARVVVNATGAFADEVRRLAEPGAGPLIAPSQGVHLVFDRDFLPGRSAIMVPHTSDGRVLFAIPWHGRTLVGTTDTELPGPELEPRAQEQEIDFILATAALYLRRAPARADVRSVFAGIRPLVRAVSRGAADHAARPGHSDQASDTRHAGRASDAGRAGHVGRFSRAARRATAALPRDHVIHVDDSGLLTIAGGKWTTYRRMAEDVVDRAAALGHLPERPCRTKELNVHGWIPAQHGADPVEDPLQVYGSDAPALRELQREDPALAEPLHADLPYTGAQVVWAARHEMARTVEDVLARRTRALFLDARAAIAMAPRVAELLAAELSRDADWAAAQVQEFTALAAGYLVRD